MCIYRFVRINDRRVNLISNRRALKFGFGKIYRFIHINRNKLNFGSKDFRVGTFFKKCSH